MCKLITIRLPLVALFIIFYVIPESNQWTFGASARRVFKLNLYILCGCGVRVWTFKLYSCNIFNNFYCICICQVALEL